MKNAFIGLLILILSAWAQYAFSAEPIQLARMNPYVAGVVAGASCTTSSHSLQVQQNTNSTFSEVSGSNWRASAFVLSGTTTITEVVLRLRQFTAGTVTLSLYSSISGSGTEISGTTVNLVDRGTDENNKLVSFVLSTPKQLTAGTYYYVLRTVGVVRHYYVATGSTGYWYSSNGGSSWTEASGASGEYYIYGCTP